MENQIHTVLGASGATGRAVIKELQNKKLPIRAVSRNSSTKDVENRPANLLIPSEAKEAIKGSAYVYLCVGLPYRADIWRKEWPLLMNNIISACQEANARLIFLDNLYMYGPAPLPIPFDENCPQKPGTTKGIARKKSTDLLLKAMQEGRIHAVIGRSADFYGPFSSNSAFYNAFLERMLQGKAPQFLGRPHTKHTYANVADNGKALVALALDKSTYGQVWHLPVGEPISIEEVTTIFNRALDTNFKISFIPPLLRKLISFISPEVKEVSEMLYQFNADYVMSDRKFKTHFPDFTTTSYEQGIRSMIESFQNKNLVETA